jgi:hypothetical protein
VADSVFDTLTTISDGIYLPKYKEILNFFDNRSTNVSTESFDAKFKALRANVIRVNDSTFFFGIIGNMVYHAKSL